MLADEFSNVHNSDRSCDVTQSDHIKMYENIARSRLFGRLAKRSIRRCSVNTLVLNIVVPFEDLQMLVLSNF